MSPKKRSPRNAKNKRGRGNIPVDLGTEYQVDVVEMSPNGEGVARVKGYMLFVAGGKVGDHVKVKIVRVDSVSADAEIVP